jgi:hypothetical protein
MLFAVCPWRHLSFAIAKSLGGFNRINGVEVLNNPDDDKGEGRDS